MATAFMLVSSRIAVWDSLPSQPHDPVLQSFLTGQELSILKGVDVVGYDDH